jgi:hypothetical protein
MAAPTSDGAIVQDETAHEIVDVNFNFSNTGSGGNLEVFQSDQLYHILSGFPLSTDSGWTAAVDANGNAPSDGPQSISFNHVGFTQTRGTIRYYYARRKNGNTIELGAPYPVGEHVPSRPTIQNVTFNHPNYTQATVNALPISDSITTVYYYATTSSSQPAYQAVSSAQTSPPSGWQTSNVFSVTPSQKYFFYALGWTHNNPGPDGAVLSDVVAATAEVSFGLEIYGTNGVKILDVSDRVTRVVGGTNESTTSSVPNFGYVDIPVTDMVNDDSWLVLVYPTNTTDSESSLKYSVVLSTGSFRLSNYTGAATPFKYLVTRT